MSSIAPVENYNTLCKEVSLSLDIRHSKNSLKPLFQNIYLMLEFIYHKTNSFITTVVYDRIFQKHLSL